MSAKTFIIILFSLINITNSFTINGCEQDNTWIKIARGLNIFTSIALLIFAIYG